MAANGKTPPARPAVKALRSYDEDYLLCRRGNLGHVWAVLGYFRGAEGTVCRDLECERCGSKRVDKWTEAGERLQPSYTYADQYQMSFDGEDYVDARDVRVEAMRRATVYANEENMLAHLTGGK